MNITDGCLQMGGMTALLEDDGIDEALLELYST